ncbi:MAG: hypothetical protein NC038_00880 [Paludibacter sp.]|nr:hypothetical protein [Bacteroidales bacterium]MCM1068559.1 hypothetical protein [Prevotella sp.]MCM1353223.1 hypothetical protein [Bacteroides sp.]MCM1442369.1 hypothetical protein [Muribaculum sp.]MCM1481188.1 hypothetical protein [Paludibacter sp.]
MCYPSKEWRRIASEQPLIKTTTFHYIVPLIIVCMAAAFICSLLYEHQPYPAEIATAHLLIVGISLFGTYLLCISGGTWLLCKTGIPEQQIEQLHNLEAYAMSNTFITTLLTTIIPQAEYLQMLHIYTAYILYEGYPLLIPDYKEQHISTVTILTLLLSGLPLLIRLALKLLLPNL